MTADNPLQAGAQLGVALALHGLVTDLLSGLQEGVEDGDQRCELGLEFVAPRNELLKERQLHLLFKYFNFNGKWRGRAWRLLSYILHPRHFLGK